MTETHRIERPGVSRIFHQNIGWIEACSSQLFHRTPKTWELWTSGKLPRRIAFWRSSSIFWVVEKDEDDD